MPEIECLRCGVCCRTFAIFASLQDAEREPRIAQETIRVQDGGETPDFAYRMYPLPFHNACCFQNADGLCSIHETRPDVCRRFQPGSPECIQARNLAAAEGERRAALAAHEAESGG